MKVRVIFTGLMLLIFLIGASYLVKILREPKTPADEKVLKGVQEELQSHGLQTLAGQTGEMWWGEEEERFFFHPSAQTLVTGIGLPKEEVSQYVTPQAIRIFENPLLNQVYGWLNDYFNQKGFSPNGYNSIAPQVGLAWSDYIAAYEREDLKCTVTTHNEVTSTTNEETGVQNYFIEIITACEDDLNSIKEEQGKFIIDLGLTGTDVGISVVTRVGKILDLALFYRNSPDAYQIIAQENGQLTALYNSQTDGPTPSCAKMQQAQVPNTFYLSCK